MQSRRCWKEICRGALALPPSPGGQRPVDLLLESLALLILEGPAGAAGKLREAGRVFTTDEISLSDALHWGLAATAASNAMWDFHTSAAIARKHVEMLRRVGALGQLPVHLAALAFRPHGWVNSSKPSHSSRRQPRRGRNRYSIRSIRGVAVAQPAGQRGQRPRR